MPRLFSPLTLRSVQVRNRIFISPMCQYSSENGVPNNWHLVHLGARAIGGAGLVMTEATAVAPEGRISPQDLGLWNDAQAAAFQPITRFIKDQGATPAIQLAHAGRKAATAAPAHGGKPLSESEGGWQPRGPSPIPFGAGYATPRALDAAEIDAIPRLFGEAAARALQAGFEVAEIHMAHGYLLHSFLSPISNRRQDGFGGSLENRARLPLMVTEAVRSVWPGHLPVLVRISATDWVDGGWDLEQSVQLSGWLKARGVDMIDCSSGGLVPDAIIPAAHGFQTPFAAAIRQQAGIPTIAVGLITEPAQAEHILVAGQADAVALGRESLRDPHWPLRAAARLGVEMPWPSQYDRARPIR